MKACVVMGSPRRGNTYAAVERFLEQTGKHVRLDVDWLWLKDAGLKLCRGCNLCIFKGEHLCPLKDDRTAIETRMLAADVVIFASPVYAMNVTALMKNLQDRFAYRLHRPAFFGRHAAFIVTSGAVGHRNAMKQLTVWNGTGFWGVCKLALTTPPFPLKAKGKAATERKIDRAADKFGRRLANGRKRPVTLESVIHYHLAGGVARLLGRHDPADWRYWSQHGWLNPKGFFWKARPAFWMRWLARLAEGVMIGELRRVLDWDALEAGKSPFSEKSVESTEVKER